MYDQIYPEWERNFIATAWYWQNTGNYFQCMKRGWKFWVKNHMLMLQSKTFIQSWCSGSMNSYNNTSIIVLYFCSKLPPIFFCINLFWNIPKNLVENSCVEAYRSLGEHQGFCYTSVQLPPIFFCIPFILKHSEKSCWELLHWS